MRKIFGRIFRHRKLLAFLAFCFTASAASLLMFIPTIASAQYSLDAHNKAVSDPGQNKQKFDQQTLAGFINSANTALVGCQENNCPPDLKVGAIGVTSQMIAGLYANPPASGLAYVQDVFHRINPVQPAYAQTGTGFSRLAPLLNIWRAFRNFAYVLFAVVFVAIGLAIMFRMKLDPRTTITIQSAIPRLVIALLLITFSYAMAGFMIDLMYVLISLTVLLFVGNDPVAVADLQRQFTTGGVPVLWGHLWGLVGGSTTALTLGATSIIGLILGAFAALPVALLFPPALPLVVLAGAAGVGAAVILLVLLVIILYIIFRLFLELLRAYIGILLAVILGPIQIAIGVIPVLPGFGAWLRGLATNLSIFVAVAFVLMLGGAIVRATTGGNLWNPPLLAGGSLISQGMPVLIGLGVLLIINQVPQAVRNLFAGRAPEFAVLEAVGATVTQPAAGYMEARSRRATGATASGLWGAGARILSGIGRR